MQRFLDYFEHRKMNVDLTITFNGNIFTVTRAKTQMNGQEIVAEGVSRRSIDVPDDEMAQRISGGRAIKALYLKAKYLEMKKALQAEISVLADGPTKKNLLDQLRILEKRHKSLVHGHVHLLMG
jgi:hypothetical protein